MSFIRVTLLTAGIAAFLHAQDTISAQAVQSGTIDVQTLPVPPPGGVVIAGHAGPGQGEMGFVSHEFTYVARHVTGAPYSAEEVTETVQTLGDGNRIVNSTTARVYRDSEGRVRREVSLSAPGDSSGHVLITISDPVAGTTYSLDPQTKVAHKVTLPKVLEDSPKLQAMSTDKHYAEFTFSGPVTVNPEKKIAHPNHEDLGLQDIGGVNAQGSRETTTIQAGAIGNERPIVITSEHWFSPELQMDVKSLREDPRFGNTTFSVSNLNRAEPDPSLFQVPADYTVQEPKMFLRTDAHKLP